MIDLCARLPYGVICTDNRHGASKVTEVDIVSEVIYLLDVDEYVEIKNCKPYLRPLSSMTKEEDSELDSFIAATMFASQNKNPLVQLTQEALLGDFFNKHHLDYRGLIEEGLALEAPKDMYK